MAKPVYDLANVELDRSLPAMDREQIDMLLMADDEEESNSLAKELFEIYESESREKLEGLDAVCAAKDAQSLRGIIHFIAGSAGNLGLTRLNHFYRSIEKAIDSGQFDEFERCAEPIRREFEESCQCFKESFDLK